ncbi:LysR family transcriptional regulator [Paenirhodobacter populi]|uniref:LysR family transcriptional regulator n=1 Tax=Paenirhodobacter populi TaxID=2306993 RepID=A0A443IV31_9RHOB|nr:LysR family transcriptional regulator [Sinirhodobacter populi]RWR11979.1 LysR family transcriptional regulator [Sinirhodobacter populi]
MDQFNLLRLFVAIADHGSLAAAGRALSLSPATVTVGLQRLEERVAAPLVTRTTRRLSLTPEGERFLADCRRILADVDEAMEAAADRGRLRGEIRVTGTNDFGRNRLVPVIDRFMRANPEISVALMLSDSVLDLTEEGFDVAVRVGPFVGSRPGQRVLLCGTRKICAAPAYWDRAGRPAHPRDLAQHNCMVLARPDAPQTTWHFREGDREFGVRIRGDRTANDGGALRNWAIAGAGVVLKSSIDIEEDLAAGRLESVLDDFTLPDINLYAVYPASRRLSRRVAVFIDYLAENL